MRVDDVAGNIYLSVTSGRPRWGARRCSVSSSAPVACCSAGGGRAGCDGSRPDWLLIVHLYMLAGTVAVLAGGVQKDGMRRDAARPDCLLIMHLYAAWGRTQRRVRRDRGCLAVC